MKICFALPSAHIGGFRTTALNLGRAFLQDGHTAHAVIVARGAATIDLGDVASFEKELPVSICIQRRVFSRSRFIARIVRAIEEINPDVLAVNHTLWVQAALPYLPPHIKRLIMIHNTTPQELDLPRGNSDWWDKLIAVGPVVEDELLKNWPRERVRMIPVGVPEPGLSPRDDDSRRDVIRLCFAGRLAQDQKNILLIPQIAQELARQNVSFRWQIIGDGPDRSQLQSAIRANGLADRFELLGARNQEEVQNLLSRQDVLVLPSFYESMGYVLQEAQMLGVVPIATRLEKSTAFVITDHQTGRLCRSADARDFADAIAALCADRNELRRLSINARRSVRQRFEISVIARQWYDLFTDLYRDKSCMMHQEPAILGAYPLAPELLPPRWTTAARLLQRKLGRSAG